MMPLIRFTALAAAILLTGCFEVRTPAQEHAAAERNTDRMLDELKAMQGSPVTASVDQLWVSRDDVNSVTCWSKGNNTLTCLPNWMLSAPKHKSIWPTGKPCDGHETCIAFDHSRRAFDDFGEADPEGQTQ